MHTFLPFTAPDPDWSTVTAADELLDLLTAPLLLRLTAAAGAVAAADAWPTDFRSEEDAECFVFAEPELGLEDSPRTT